MHVLNILIINVSIHCMRGDDYCSAYLVLLYSEKPVLSCCGMDSTPQLDCVLTNSLQKLGVRVAYMVPRYILSSTILIDKYVHLPTAKG